MNRSYLNSERTIALPLETKPSITIQLLLMVLFVILTSSISFGQSCNVVNNPTFTGNATGWSLQGTTATGWYYEPTWAPNEIYIEADGVTNVSLKQSLTGLLGSSLTVSFKIKGQNANRLSTCPTTASLVVKVGGTTYMTINNPAGSVGTPNTQITTANVSTSNGATYTQTGFPLTVGGATSGITITQGTISLTIPSWSSGTTADVEFVATTSNTASGSCTAWGGDDWFLDDISVIATNPTAYNVTGTSVCFGGTATIGVNNSQSGVNYQLVRNGVTNVGSAVAGTGSAISFPNQTTVGVYTVVATAGSTTCTTTMNGSVSINPNPTLTGAAQSAAVCAGSGALINLTGLLASSTSTINYTINGVAQTAITGVAADASGAGSFTSAALTSANNGQTLRITGVTTTSATPNCSTSFTQNVTLSVRPTPTLTGAAQSTVVCPGSGALINLTGLLASSTSTISYSINGVAQTAITGVAANASGAGSFTSAALTAANNGQILQITGITVTSATPNCSSSFTQNVTLSVSTLPTITTAATPAVVTSVCQSASAQTTTMAYTATTGTPTSYSIDWATLTDQGSTAFAFAAGGGNITGITVPAGTAANTYTGTMTITNSSGCTAAKTITLTVTANLSAAAITPNTAQTFCPSGTGNLLTVTPTGGSTVTYQWGVRSVSGGTITSLSGKTASTYTPAFADLGTGTWYIVCTSTPTCGSAIISNEVTVTISGPTTVGVTICAGGSGTLTSSTSCSSSSPTTVGPNFAGSGATSGGTGDAWTNPGRIIANDNSYTSATIADNSSSENLLATNFGFSIPTTATITGIEVTIGRYSSSPNKIYDNNVQLLVGGSATGTNKALSSTTYWPTTETAATYGSTTDLWGATLTPAIINASNFGVLFDANNNNNGTARTAYVDYIQISVTYTLPASIDWYTASSGGIKLGSGSSFNPVGVTNSGLANTNTAGTTTFYAECSLNTGCRTPVNFVINAVTATPAVTLTQPTCAVATGTITINTPAPAAGTIYTVVGPSPAVTSVANSTGVFSGLAAGTYSVTAQAASSCVSSATSAVITSAVTKTWNGSWSPSGTPTSDNLVIINANYSTSSNGDLNACSLVINSGYKLTVEAGKFVIIQNDLTVNGTLDVLDKGSLVMVNDAGIVTNTGTTNIHRFTTVFQMYDYTYWSTPVVSTNIATTFSGWNTNYAYEYLPANFFDGNGDNIDDDDNDWSHVSTMTPAKGYIVMVPNPVSGPSGNNPSEVVFSGKVNNGVQKVTGVITGGNYLVGNPYPSALDADAFINYNAGVIDGTLYFWTHNTAIQLASAIGAGKAGSGRYAYTSDDYASYNLVGGVGVASQAISGGTIPTGKIASTQSFFTTTNASIVGTNEIVFNNAMRLGSGGTTLSNSQFFKTRKPKGTVEKNRIWLNLSNEEGAFKQTLLGYVTGATNNNEGLFDGESYDGNEFVDFYSVNQDKNLVIQGRALPFDDNDEVPLGYRTTIEGTFNIDIEQVDGVLTGQDVFIEDKLTDTEFNLKHGKYAFNTAVGTFNDRFVLKYKSANKTLGTGSFDTQTNKVIVSVKNKQINVNSSVDTIAKVVIYDVLGRQIFKKDNVNTNDLSISDFVASNQALIVKTTLQNGTTSTDKIVY